MIKKMVTRYCRKVATTENLTFGASMTKNIFLTFSIFQKGIKKKKNIDTISIYQLL